MCEWLIRLNGAPFLVVTGPYYISPVQAAREWLRTGTNENEQVTVRGYHN